ncbi:uncharacterized protein LOC135472856 [Liolophura sinensis]|uniref:uncharacterized protein LOC135472856 n=1 Tax=Liolophura sinensis TaxID=3198878 RepID=UPI0031580944
MFGLLVFISLASLVLCQIHETPPTPPSHPTDHPHPPHPTEPHPPHPNDHSPPPEIDHTFSDANIAFYKDLPNRAIILKSDSGCYVTQLDDRQLQDINDTEKLLRIEAEIIHHIRTAHHFHMADNPDQYSSEIQTSCPKLYAHHKEH